MGQTLTTLVPQIPRATAGHRANAPVEHPARKATARYLRDTGSGIIQSRYSPPVPSRSEIRRSWQRAAGLALDLIQNSGQLKGATDQVLADTVGVELVLNPKPDLSALGYGEEETAQFIKTVKERWKRYAWNPAECDMRGKYTVPQLVDIALRWHIAYGEVTGILDYMPRAQRRRYGIKTGTKLCLVPPTRLVQDTNEVEGLFQGVYHDENGRPVSYLFAEPSAGIIQKHPYAARDRMHRPIVLHVFDPNDATDVRGISVLAPAIRRYLQREKLDDVTLETAILQTVFAQVLTSEKPSMEAFEALEALKETGVKGATEFAGDFVEFMQGSLEGANNSRISTGIEAQVSKLGPGEKFEFLTSSTPGPDYAPFAASMARDIARAIGISYGGLTMDHNNATYSSVRMENASVWGVVLRRRERIAAPICQALYENWLDEEIGEGRIPFKGGYDAYFANRDAISWAQWRGPAKPTADDYKSARASSERMENGTSSLEVEAAELGLDEEELFESRRRTHERYIAAGMRSPYEPRSSGNSDPVGEEVTAPSRNASLSQ